MVVGHGTRPTSRPYHPYLLQSQLSPATRGAYRDCLGRLDLQYAKLLVSGGLQVTGRGRQQQRQSADSFFPT